MRISGTRGPGNGRSRRAFRRTTVARPTPVAKHRKPARKAQNRAEKSEARRQAIVAAALDEFCARGFAATRIEDVAARAGVAKGTIYLHFDDKQALFREIVTTMLVPLVATLEAPPPDIPLRDVIWGVLPFVVLMMLAVVVLCVFPGIATWFSDLVMGK